MSIEQNKGSRISRTNCCVFGCRNSYCNTNKSIKFYSFPGRWHEADRRKIWIENVKRTYKDNPEWQPRSFAKICSAHFIGNNKSNHPHSPSFNPTVFPKISDTLKDRDKLVSSSDEETALQNEEVLDVVTKVMKFMKDEAEFYKKTKQSVIPLTNFKQRLMAATRISEKGYKAVMKRADISNRQRLDFYARRKRTLQMDDKDENVFEEPEIPEFAINDQVLQMLDPLSNFSSQEKETTAHIESHEVHYIKQEITEGSDLEIE